MPERREEASDGLSPLCEGNPLAGQLARLVPVPPGFERDALLFAAGSAARSATVSRWRWATAAAIFTAVGAWAYVGLTPDAPTRTGRTADVTNSPQTNPQAEPASPKAAPVTPEAAPLVVTFVDADPGDRVRGLRLRNDILTAGLGLIPSTSHPEVTVRSTLAELERSLGLPAGTFAVPMMDKSKPKDEPD